MAAKKEKPPVAENERIAALEKEIGDLRAELKEAKGRRAADPDVVDALITRITELEGKVTEEKKISLPGGGEIKLPAGDPPSAKPPRAADKKKGGASEGGNSLYD